MTDRAYALAAGLFIVVFAAALVVTALWLRGPKREGDVYVVVASHPVTGLRPDSPVAYRGVEAGAVERIRIASGGREIEVGIRVDRGLPVTYSTVARLRTQLVTGQARLELDDPFTDTRPLPTSAAAPGRIPLRPSLVASFETAGPELLQNLTRLTANLNALVDEPARDRVGRILTSLEAATDGLRQLEERLGKAAGAVPALTTETRRTLEHVDALVGDLRRVAGDVGTLTRASQGAGHDLREETLPRVNAAVTQLGRAAEDVERLTRSLRESPQSLLRGREQPVPGPGERGYKRAAR
jgi:phospholipid/cholesterol/gamma-HCH transport system substrate-binding protein